MSNQRYDFLIAGGGAAGLSLAYELIRSPLKNSKILIVDRDAKNQDDRTWCFWTDQPTPYDAILHRTWHQLRFECCGLNRLIPLGEYRYAMLRGIDFYQFTRNALQQTGNVDFVQANVEAIEDLEDGARLTAGGVVYEGQWLFDSLFRPQEMPPRSERYYSLLQHFKGWEIETPHATFDPEIATLFDFRTPQNGAMRFLYILPFTPERALVEYTLFSTALLEPHEYVEALKQYIEEVLGIREYQVIKEENGIIPMTDQPFERKLGRHVLATGTKAGRVKPSSGYAFLRILRDSQAIVRSLVEHGDPFHLPHPAWRYSFYDAVMLELMESEGENIGKYFSYLFGRNPIGRVFRFLDETGPLPENLALMATMPFWPFLKASLRIRRWGRK